MYNIKKWLDQEYSYFKFFTYIFFMLKYWEIKSVIHFLFYFWGLNTANYWQAIKVFFEFYVHNHNQLLKLFEEIQQLL